MDRTRPLVFHGVFLFLLGLLMGLVVQNLANPRIGLSAHVGTLLNGTFLLALGPAWRSVRLQPGPLTASYWLVVGGSYVSCIALFLAGVFGTSGSTPLHGAGHAGTPGQEALVGFGLTAGGGALLLGCALLVWGLRPTPGPGVPVDR